MSQAPIPSLPPVEIVAPGAQTVAARGAASEAAAGESAGVAYAAIVDPTSTEWRAQVAAELSAWGITEADVDSLLEAYGEPAAGQVHTIPLARGSLSHIVLAAADDSASAVRKAAASAARAVGQIEELWLHPTTGGPIDAAVEGALLGAAKSLHWGAGATPYRAPALNVLADPDSAAEAVRRGTEGARVSLIARALANTPSNLKSPAWLADAAQQIAAQTGLTSRVWEDEQLAAEGFGGIIAVGQGSARPPRLVELRYEPTDADGPPIVLVGKGITFDTGGVNVKPAAGMLMMKTDMSGAAIVLAVLAGCRAHGVRRRVIGLLPLAENALGGNSYRPDDVITQYDGRTVEIGNTDAEGRLVLADALGYAVHELQPAALIDVATLTGAARVALAGSYGASFGTDNNLHTAIREACAAAGEPMWALPLVPDYRADLESEVADLSHVGPRAGGSGAGSITAALFLREFVGEVPWVHLDIAGVGRSESDTGILAKGATGYGARGLLRWLADLPKG